MSVDFFHTVGLDLSATPEGRFLKAMLGELSRARAEHTPPINSPHEAWGVIYEELDEFFDEVKLRPSKRDPAAMARELVHTATMCLRAAADLGLMDVTATPAEAGSDPACTNFTCWCCGRLCPEGAGAAHTSATLALAVGGFNARIWCSDCEGHTRPDKSLPVGARTYLAIHREPCPFRVAFPEGEK